MQDTARRLAPLILADDTGRPVTMGDAWAAQTVLLVFIRHFG
jgi:hypothetical protein